MHFLQHMSIPLQVTFRDMESTVGLERAVSHWVDRLGRIYDRIERCEVVIERPHQHQRRGQHVRVRIALAVPGNDLVISREPGEDGAHENAYVAIRDAFRAARRRLQERVRRVA